MIYLSIIFISPLYFLVRKKWGGFIINGILYALACLCVLTIIGFIFGVIFWALGVMHAGWNLRKELMVEHADLIATKMAEKLQAHQKQ